MTETNFDEKMYEASWDAAFDYVERAMRVVDEMTQDHWTHNFEEFCLPNGKMIKARSCDVIQDSGLKKVKFESAGYHQLAAVRLRELVTNGEPFMVYKGESFEDGLALIFYVESGKNLC